MAGRFEYISSMGSVASNSVNLMYGPGSAAWSLTATPTYQYQKFFTRADISFVQALSYTPGFAFGSQGHSEPRPAAWWRSGSCFKGQDHAVEVCRRFCFWRNGMQDVVFVAITIAFFALSLGYVHFCDRVK